MSFLTQSSPTVKCPLPSPPPPNSPPGLKRSVCVKINHFPEDTGLRPRQRGVPAPCVRVWGRSWGDAAGVGHGGRGGGCAPALRSTRRDELVLEIQAKIPDPLASDWVTGPSPAPSSPSGRADGIPRAAVPAWVPGPVTGCPSRPGLANHPGPRQSAARPGHSRELAGEARGAVVATQAAANPELGLAVAQPGSEIAESGCLGFGGEWKGLQRERERRKGEREGNPELRMKQGREKTGEKEGGGRERWRGAGKRREARRDRADGGSGVGGTAGFRDVIERRIWRRGKGARRRKGNARARRKREGDGPQRK